jgi:hypothetical protein
LSDGVILRVGSRSSIGRWLAGKSAKKFAQASIPNG